MCQRSYVTLQPATRFTRVCCTGDGIRQPAVDVTSRATCFKTQKVVPGLGKYLLRVDNGIRSTLCSKAFQFVILLPHTVDE